MALVKFASVNFFYYLCTINTIYMRKLLHKLFGLKTKDMIILNFQTFDVEVTVEDIYDLTVTGTVKGQTFEITTNRNGRITDSKILT